MNIDDYRAATNCSLQFPCATELSLWGKGARGNFSFLADLSHMFHFAALTHFSVQCPDFGLAQLIELLNHLPNLHSLTLYANTSYLSDELFQFDSMENRIVNVTIRGPCTIQQIRLLIRLCPRVKCLEIEVDEEQLEPIVRSLLLEKTMVDRSASLELATVDLSSKPSFFKDWNCWQRAFFSLFTRPTNETLNCSSENFSVCPVIRPSHHRSLFSLCFFNPKPGMEQKLQRMIHREKLLNDHSIGSVFNYLYLWW